jgi:predicted metal-dependent HD superfamily phosphohydrolase
MQAIKVTTVFSHAAQPALWTNQHRNMATLKHISMRLKSVKNIQKITQSMKMVSAAKYVSIVSKKSFKKM